MSPMDRVAQLYPPGTGLPLFAFASFQGYGGGILAQLHMRMIVLHHRNSYILEISSLLHDNRKAIPMLTSVKCSHLVLCRLISYVTGGITNKTKLNFCMFLCILM